MSKKRSALKKDFGLISLSRKVRARLIELVFEKLRQSKSLEKSRSIRKKISLRAEVQKLNILFKKRKKGRGNCEKPFVYFRSLSRNGHWGISRPNFRLELKGFRVNQKLFETLSRFFLLGLHVRMKLVKIYIVQLTHLIQQRSCLSAQMHAFAQHNIITANIFFIHIQYDV